MRKKDFKHLALLAVAAAGLASCSNDKQSEPVPDTSDGTIRFGARTEYSRAGGDITTANIAAFNVWAYTGAGNTFMENVAVTKNGTNTWTYSPVRYWPANESLQFYAASPADWVPASGPLKPVPVTNYYADQDLVYAVSPAMTGNAMGGNAQVIFNFKHALSKVTVKMSSSNQNLTVKVSNVVMANIASGGNFNFPSEATSGVAGSDNAGTWTDQNSPMIVMLHVSQTDSELITLTNTPTDMATTGQQIGGAKYLIPQPLNYRSNGSGKDNFITVMCSVYDSTTGEKLWPNANTPEENIVEGSKFGDGLLKFPLQTSQFNQWQPGYHYIYNLVINSNEEMSPIEFGNPSVEGFVDVSTTYE